MLLLQIPKIVRCNVADIYNEKTVIIQFQYKNIRILPAVNDALFIHIDVWELCSVISND